MTTVQSETEQNTAAPAEPAAVLLDARRKFAAHYLAGEGLEIGALHLPLSTPRRARVRYVDRMPVPELRSEYPELENLPLTPVDVIDNGETLETVPDESQDFIIANHFLEHCEDPIRTIETHMRKLKRGGVLFYAVPDKRYTFDFRRPVTPLDHMVADHEEGPQRSRQDHYEEWARFVVNEGWTEEETIARSRELEESAYSIHMHVWTQSEFLRLILHIRDRLDSGFDIEAAARQGIEFLVVLRKAGPAPTPSWRTTLPVRARKAAQLVRGKLRRG